MKLFNKKGKEKRGHPILIKVVVGINHRLRRLADYLQKKADNYSARTQRVVLVAFCMTFISISVCVAIEGIRNKATDGYRVRAIKVIPLASEKTIQPKVSIQELSRIHGFKVYLERSSKKARDSLLMNRPYLMDTLNFLETLYQNQIKSK